MNSISLSDAVLRVNDGGIIVYPTETFFGIGCRADREDAILRVFQVKRRPLNMPLPLVLGNVCQLDMVAAVPEELCIDVAALAQFWPGPLTLILPARNSLPAPLVGETKCIALRISSHPAARDLATICGFPIVSTSANISKRPAVTIASKLDPELLAALDPHRDCVLNLPPDPSGGLASTIARPAGKHSLEIYRKGSFPVSKLEEAGFTLVFKENQS